MPKDERTSKELVGRLKTMLENDKQREAAKQIERASFELLGDSHFAYGPEAQKLAVVDLEAFEAFAERLNIIRLELDEEYAKAAGRLGENDET